MLTNTNLLLVISYCLPTYPPVYLLNTHLLLVISCCMNWGMLRYVVSEPTMIEGAAMPRIGDPVTSSSVLELSKLNIIEYVWLVSWDDETGEHA